VKFLLRFVPIFISFTIGIFWISSPTQAGMTEEIMKLYHDDTKKIYPSFKDFDAAKGKEFYHSKQMTKDGKQISCAKCHTADPRSPGQSQAGKVLEPMAPAVNPKRFTDKAKVEKWFKRNCMDVYQRLCTPNEKGNFIRYLQSVK
jgi:cytochrome c peroxidase